MNYGVSQKQKRSSEDRYQVVNFDDFSFLSIFDGHGKSGEQHIHVVDFCCNNLHSYLETYLKQVNLDDPNVIVAKIGEVFHRLDQDMYDAKMVGGCTCTAILIDNKRNYIYQINLGDSRSIIFNDNGVVSSTTDHKPTDCSEITRIFEAGQIVKAGRVCGYLAVSRAFGDYYPALKFIDKNFNPINSAVSVKPDIKIQSKIPCKIILTSDAPFERGAYNNTMLINLFRVLRLDNENLNLIADQIVDTIDKITTDDITIIVVEIL